MNPSTPYKRISRDGYTTEQAHSIPKGKPRWMHEIEQREGMAMPDILKECALVAHHTGYTCADLAREWGIHRDTLGHWCRKWGIKFPRGASEVQKASAKQAMKTINSRRKA